MTRSDFFKSALGLVGLGGAGAALAANHLPKMEPHDVPSLTTRPGEVIRVVEPYRWKPSRGERAEIEDMIDFLSDPIAGSRRIYPG